MPGMNTRGVLMQWARKDQIHGDYMICTAMSMNGAVTSMILDIMQNRKTLILEDQPLAVGMSNVEDPGMVIRMVLRTAGAPRRLASTVFGWWLLWAMWSLGLFLPVLLLDRTPGDVLLLDRTPRDVLLLDHIWNGRARFK